MEKLGYVGKKMVVRVILAPFDPVEIEVPVNASFISIFHQIDLKLRERGFKGKVKSHADLPVFLSEKDKRQIEKAETDG